MEKRSFAADLGVIPKMLAFVTNAFAQCHADAITENRVKIAGEEALANVVSYAYQGETGLIEIECGVVPADDCFVIRISDRGAPYNPLGNEPPDLGADLEDRDIGGLGVYLYTTIMDKVSYTYEDGRNILMLRKKLPEKEKGQNEAK